MNGLFWSLLRDWNRLKEENEAPRREMAVPKNMLDKYIYIVESLPVDAEDLLGDYYNEDDT